MRCLTIQLCFSAWKTGGRWQPVAAISPITRASRVTLRCALSDPCFLRWPQFDTERAALIQMGGNLGLRFSQQ